MFEFAAAMFIVAVAVVFATIGAGYREQTPAEERRHGPIDSAIVCPHCGAEGCVRRKEFHEKQGVSDAKALAAVLTAGLSLLAVGVFRVVTVTKAHCMSCASTWVV